jgi:hypothetical protein
VTGKPGAPHLYTLESCNNFITEIEGYKWKKARNSIAGDFKEEPMDGKDHLMDGLNGFLASRPMDIKWSLPTEATDDDFEIDMDTGVGQSTSRHMSF